MDGLEVLGILCLKEFVSLRSVPCDQVSLLLREGSLELLDSFNDRLLVALGHGKVIGWAEEAQEVLPGEAKLN